MLYCGSETEAGPLPPCEVQVLNELDVDKDQCAEPYVRKEQGCILSGPVDKEASKLPMLPMLELVEFRCEEEGFSEINDDLLARAKDMAAQGQMSQRQLELYQKRQNQCVACGGEKEIPCLAMDFYGCRLQDGYIYSLDQVQTHPCCWRGSACAARALWIIQREQHTR